MYSKQKQKLFYFILINNTTPLTNNTTLLTINTAIRVKSTLYTVNPDISLQTI
jgi:hypothetical protein